MQRLNAIDAIAPAWHHTRQLLFTRFNWRLLLKIGAIACFARMGGCNGNIGNPGKFPHAGSPALSAAFFAFAIFAGIFVLLIALAFFYLSSRLSFVLFDVVLRRDTLIAPIWRRYGPATWRWMGLQLLFYLAAILCLAPILIPVILHFVHALSHTGDAAPPQLASFFVTFFAFLGATFLVILVIAVAYSLLLDFGLPSMALEATPLAETVRRVLRLTLAEPGQVALYILMRFVLSLAGGIACYIPIGLGMLIALIPLGGAGAALWIALRHASLPGHIVMIAGWAILGLIFLALLFLAAMMLFGSVFTFLQAYALFFLGGRYPLLGDILVPNPLPAPIYPAPPPPAYIQPIDPTPA